MLIQHGGRLIPLCVIADRWHVKALDIGGLSVASVWQAQRPLPPLIPRAATKSKQPRTVMGTHCAGVSGLSTDSVLVAIIALISPAMQVGERVSPSPVKCPPQRVSFSPPPMIICD